MDESKRLKDELFQALTELHDLYRRDKGKSVSVFLHQSINMHADVETLARIVNDVQQEVERMKKEA